VSAGWVAAAVRARGLVRRRLGDTAIEAMAGCASVADALAIAAASPYGREVRVDMDLADAGHSLFAVVLWHLRVLAGWGPPMSGETMRALAAGFEVANVRAHLARLDGRTAPEPYVLGSLSTAWPSLSRTESVAALRAALGASVWGDPGTDDAAGIVVAMQLSWAKRVLDAVPGAGEWAATGAALVLSKVLAAGAVPDLSPAARRQADRLFGRAWTESTSLADLGRRLPRVARRALDQVEGPEDLWHAEARWWTTLGDSGARQVRGAVTEQSTWVGAAAVLAADAWRARAALEMADRRGRAGALVDALA
jgi:hypothetical protein